MKLSAHEVTPSVLRVIVGLGCAAAAFALAGTPAAGMLWIAAFAVACLGYGGVIDRLTKRRWSTAITLVTGLAALLGASTLLAHAGLLARPVQIAAVITGIALCLLPVTRAPGAPLSLRLYVLVAAMLLIGVELLAPQVSFDDGFNHVLAVKRLWDTGKLGLVHHQIGLQVVGESYLALMGGAATAGTFELGGCLALLVYVLSLELGEIDNPLARPLLFLLTVPAVLWPGLSEQWSGVVLYVAMFIALQRAREAKARGWHACVLAFALVLLRHEYLVVAVPYIAFALTPAWSRRATIVAVTLWFIALIPFQLALAVSVARAVLNAGLLTLAIGLVPPLRRLLGPRSDDALGPLTFASVMYGLALLLDAIRPAQHGDGATVTVCFGTAACLLWLLARQRDARAVHLGTASVVLAAIFAYTIAGPAWGEDHDKPLNRVMGAAVALRQTLVFGGPHDLEGAVASLQTFVPRGARVGFWGADAGGLDYRRNPVTDLTRGGKRTDVMTAMTAADVRRVDYVLLENIEPQKTTDAWNPQSAPTAAVESMLELRAKSDGAFLFRVRR